MINEIREILKDGYGAIIELVDREGIIDKGIFYTLYYRALGKHNSLTVVREEKDRLILKEKNKVNGMPLSLPKDSLHIFKLTGIVPTLYRVIDVALDAVKNGVAVITHLKTDEIVIESINYDDKSPMEVFKDDSLEKFQDAIEWIGSLYIRNLVIENESDVLMAKTGDQIKFSNGATGFFIEAMESGLNGVFAYISFDNNELRIPFCLLKGATITQNR